MTIVDTSQRDAEGATMGKVRRPEVLSPPTSGKSCAENVVNIRRAQQTKERSSSASNQSTLPVDSAEDEQYSLRIWNFRVVDGRLTHYRKCAYIRSQISCGNAQISEDQVAAK